MSSPYNCFVPSPVLFVLHTIFTIYIYICTVFTTVNHVREGKYMYYFHYFLYMYCIQYSKPCERREVHVLFSLFFLYNVLYSIQ